MIRRFLCLLPFLALLDIAAMAQLPPPIALSVSVNTNGVVIAPTSFWSANSNSVRAIAPPALGAATNIGWNAGHFVLHGTNVSISPTWSMTNDWIMDLNLTNDWEVSDAAVLNLDGRVTGINGVESLYLDGGVTTIRGITNVSLITPAIWNGTAIAGQVLRLTDASEGTVEFGTETSAASADSKRELLSRYRPGFSQRISANPPVVTFSPTSTIPSAVTIGPGDPGLRVWNNTAKIVGGRLQQRLYGLTNAGFAGSVFENNQHAWSVEFATTAEDMEIELLGRLHGFRIRVNDEMLTPIGFYNEGLAYGVSDSGGVAFTRLRFGARSAPQEPTWGTVYLRTTQDAAMRWQATDILTSTYAVNDSAWTGASGSTPPSGWSQFGSPTFTVATHDSVTTALNITTTATAQNLRRIGVATVGTNYVLKFRAKVISGSFAWLCSTNLITLNASNARLWTTHYVPFTAAGTEVLLNNFGAAGEIWLDDVQVYDTSAAPSVTAWAANTTYRNGDRVAPTAYTGFQYLAAIVRPEIKRVEIEMSGYLDFASVRLPTGESLANPGRQRRPVCAVLGDSYSLGANAIIPNATTHSSVLADYTAWPLTMAREMGWDARVNASGSSGYLTDGNGGRFSSRIAELINHQPDIFVISGGYNDSASTPADVAAEFVALVTTVRAALTNCVVVAVGPWAHEISSTHPTLARIRINKALRDKASELDVPFVAPIEWPVITGEQSVAGSGNAPTLITDGSVHPTAEGYEVIGRWVAGQIAAAMASKPSGPLAQNMLTSATPSWSVLGSVVTATVTHDGVTNALQVTVPNTTGNNIFTTALLSSQVGYSARKIRTRFKIKITSGSVVLGTGTPTVTGRFAHPLRVRTRPINGAWSDLSIPTIATAGNLYAPFTTANAGSWLEWEIESAWSNPVIAFYSQTTANPNTVYYLKDVIVDVLSE
jgi:lysophospholipase L1-like esterase